MPNHIISEVEISGTKEQIDELVKETKLKRDCDAEENQFDFNGIIPMPESLNIESGSSASLGLMAYSQEYYDKDVRTGTSWWKKDRPGVRDAATLKLDLQDSGEEEDKKALKLGKVAFDNIQKYGHADWYGWSIAKWGTKWNAYDVRYIDGDDTKIVIEIQTAWDTPEGIWSALIEQGFEVKGVMHGEMDGYQYIGNGDEVFDVYQNIEVEYRG